MVKPSKLTVSQKHNLKGLYFVLPFLIGFLMFYLQPIVQSLTFLFSDVKVSLEGYKSTFIGFENVDFIFNSDEGFKTALLTDILSLLWKTPVIVILSLFLALLINQKFKGRLLVRAIFFLPVILSNGVLLEVVQSDSVVQGAVAAAESIGGGTTQSAGIVDILLQAGFSQEIVDMVTTVTDSFFSLVWNSGIQMLIFLSGLQSVPSSLYEAASVEGASGWDIFCKITIPMLSPMILLNLIYTVVDSYSSTANGVITMITNAIGLSRFGQASAMAWVYFIIIGAILGIVFLVINKASNPKQST